MTYRNLTALALRISGIYLFAELFKQIGMYFLSIYGIAVMTELGGPLDKFYYSITFMGIANTVVSLFLFLKADWIAKKLIKEDKTIVTELNPLSLTRVILLTTGVIWLAKMIYLFPDFIDYCVKKISELYGNDNIKVPDFAITAYILKVVVTLFLLFKIKSISNWITKKL